jgi:hypothetical protein
LILEVFQPILLDMSSQKYSINKPLRVAGIGYFVLFLLLIITKILLPDLRGGWSDPPIFDYILLLGFGICISTIGGIYTYYSWALDAKGHMEWLESQQLTIPKLRMGWFKNYSETYALWSMRVISPIFTLVGLLLIGFILQSIFKFLFR